MNQSDDFFANNIKVNIQNPSTTKNNNNNGSINMNNSQSVILNNDSVSKMSTFPNILEGSN